MTASRARRRLGALGLAIAAVVCAGSAAAQQAPIPLRPRSDAPPPPAATPPTTVAPKATGGGAIHIEPLKAIDPNAVGVLDERRGGFGVDMWSGSQRALVQKLLPALPAGVPSPTMRSMMRRLLLSTAAVPEGAPPLGPSLLAQRVERLWAMGDTAAMLALIEAAPRSKDSAGLLRYRIDALLLDGNIAAACADLPAALAAAAAGDDGYLSKVEAFCHAQAGRTAEAELALAWLRERGQADGAFFALMETMLGLPAPDPDSLPQPRPLHLAMLKQAKRLIPADAASSAEPAVLRAVALAANARPETRLVAGEKAELMGAIDTETLRGLYAGTTFTEDEAARSLNDAAEDKGARSRALLFRAAQLQKSPTARVEIIAKAFALARQHGAFPSAARLYAPLIAEMQAGPDLVPFAGDAARALIAAGVKDKLAPWLALCESGGKAAGSPVWPLLRLMEPKEDEPLAPETLRQWLDQRPKPAPEKAQAALLFGLLDALGDKIGTETWAALMDGPSRVAVAMPQPALWHLQRIAAEDLRLAETVLLSLVSIGAGGPGALEPTSLYRVIAALRLVGFDDEARALAVEAALANGV